MTEKTGQALDLIDRVALLEKGCCGRISIRDVREAAKIDAIKVIRCRDCRHYGRSPFGSGEVGWCKLAGEHKRRDFYCGYGKKRQ